MNIENLAGALEPVNAEQIELNDAPDALESVAEQIAQIALLPDNAKLKDVVAKLNEIIEHLNTQNQPKQPKARDRGPESTRTMTEDDAKRIMIGDLKDVGHKEAAEKLGLSYGQIYSARNGFTFKKVYQMKLKAESQAQ